MRIITLLTLIIFGLLIQVKPVQAQSPSPEGVGTCILYQQITWQVKEVFQSPDGTRQRIQDVSDANHNRIVTLSELQKLGESFGAKIVPCPGVPVNATTVPQRGTTSDVADIMMSLPIPFPLIVGLGVLFVVAMSAGMALYSRKPRQPASPASSTTSQTTATLTPDEEQFVELILKDGSTLTAELFLVWAEQQGITGIWERFQTMTRLQRVLEHRLNQSTTQQQNQEGPERRGQNQAPLPGRIALPTSSHRRKSVIPPPAPTSATTPASTQASSASEASTSEHHVLPKRAKRTLAAATTPPPASVSPPSDQTEAPPLDQNITDANPLDSLGFDTARADQNWREALKKVKKR